MVERLKRNKKSKAQEQGTGVSTSVFLFSLLFAVFNLLNRSQLKRDYPLDLSILLRGGKETNKDSLSNGE